MTSRTEQLITEVRSTPLFRQLVPLEASVGWPIPVRAGDHAYLTLLLYATAPADGGAAILPPFAQVTLDWATGQVVEYVSYAYRHPLPDAPREGAIGTFPHNAVEGLTRGQYLERRGELLEAYDRVLDAVATGAPIPPYEAAAFGRLLRQLLEPALEPYYRAISPQFFKHFLALGQVGEMSGATPAGGRTAMDAQGGSSRQHAE